MKLLKKGILLVISGPSGVGKGTLIDRLLKDDPSFCLSTSVTTRQPRRDEVPGVSYFFISLAEYDKLSQEDAFVEQAIVHGHQYGTLKSEIHGRIEKGINIVLDIDTQGFSKVKANIDECVSVFIMPPSIEDLRIRLCQRKSEKPEEMSKRLMNARNEIDQAPKYDYIIINNDIDQAYKCLSSVIQAEKCSTKRHLPIIPEIRGGNV